MQQTIRGKAYVLGDDIDTDQIIPAAHLVYNLDDAEERKMYGRRALSAVPPEGAGLPGGGVPFVAQGTHQSQYAVIVGGKNFGCGSSREHAPVALNVAGVRAVVANSYARIFYRNSVDGGYFSPFECTVPAHERVRTGDEVEIDPAANTMRNLVTGEVFSLKSLGDVADIVAAGGIFGYARKTGIVGGQA